HLEGAARGEPVEHRLAHPCRIGAEALAQRERFGDALDRDAQSELVARFRDLAAAGVADVNDRAAEMTEYGAGTLEARRGAAGHDRKRAALGSIGPAGDRRVEQIDRAPGEDRRKLARGER